MKAQTFIYKAIEVGAVLERCCEFGSSLNNCESFVFNISSEIPEKLRNLCESNAQLCCEKKRQVMKCHAGRKWAKTKSTCISSIRSEMFKVTRDVRIFSAVYWWHFSFQLCCSACKVGQQIALTSGKCNQPTGDPIIDEAKNDCCVNLDSNFESAETFEAFDENAFYDETEGDDISFETCEEGHGCDYNCYIQDGAAHCGCREGQKLADDMKTCLEGSQIPEDLRIDSCEKGFFKNLNGYCDDFDECEEDKHNCRKTETCVNTVGGFNCQPVDFCPEGFYFNEDSKKCEGDRPICPSIIHHSFWSLFIPDINECETSDHCLINERCENTKGSFKCFPKTCSTGYKLDPESGDCEDIDECGNPETCDRRLKCINIPGSYTCECDYGYRKHPKHKLHCQDIDECLEQPGICHHKCINTYGSFRCSCEHGYRLNSDNQTCTDIDECEKNGKNLCLGTCKNTIGSFKCGCPEGFQLLGSRDCIGR